MEDTLSLQLERPGDRYTALAADAVVGLGSLSMMLVSRRRLAVNGTVESVGRLMARYLEGGKKGGVGDESRGADWAGHKALKNLVSGGIKIHTEIIVFGGSRKYGGGGGGGPVAENREGGIVRLHTKNECVVDAGQRPAVHGVRVSTTLQGAPATKTKY